MSIDSQTTQITIRGLDPAVKRQLQQRASRNGLSMNQLIVHTLTGAVGAGPQPKHSLNQYVGKFYFDRAFTQALDEQRQVDQALWEK